MVMPPQTADKPSKWSLHFILVVATMVVIGNYCTHYIKQF